MYDEDDDYEDAEFEDIDDDGLDETPMDVEAMSSLLGIDPELCGDILDPEYDEDEDELVTEEEAVVPPMRLWDAYAFGDDGVEIIQSIHRNGSVGTLVLNDGRPMEHRVAQPIDFKGRRLVGMTPFGANGPDSLTVITRYTKTVRDLYNTDALPGLGGPNVLIFNSVGFDLWNLSKRLPVVLTTKRIFSPMIEEVLDDCLDDREIVMTRELWSRLESRIKDSGKRRKR